MRLTDTKHLADSNLRHCSFQGSNCLNVLFGDFGIGSSSHVDLVGDGLQVIGADARFVSAQVVKLHAGRDWSVYFLPIDDVSRLFYWSDLDASISAAEGQIPYPAGRDVSAIHDGISFGDSILMVENERSRLTFDPSAIGVGSFGEGGLLSAPAPTKSKGNRGIVESHCRGLSCDVAPPVVEATRGNLLPHFTTPEHQCRTSCI